MSDKNKQQMMAGPTKADDAPAAPTIEQREAELAKREAELREREAALEALAEQPLDNRPTMEGLPPRTSASEEVLRRDGANPKAIRQQLGAQRQMDVERYQLAYPEKTLMWINDIGGDVQRWIDAGAEPVPVMTDRTRQFEGLTDRHESNWVRVIGGTNAMNQPYYVYLLMMDPQRYDEVKLSPIRERQELVRRAIFAGRDQSDMGSSGPKLPSYAANLPTGGRGYADTRQTVKPQGR